MKAYADVLDLCGISLGLDYKLWYLFKGQKFIKRIKKVIEFT